MRRAAERAFLGFFLLLLLAVVVVPMYVYWFFFEWKGVNDV